MKKFIHSKHNLTEHDEDHPSEFSANTQTSQTYAFELGQLLRETYVMNEQSTRLKVHDNSHTSARFDIFNPVYEFNQRISTTSPSDLSLSEHSTLFETHHEYPTSNLSSQSSYSSSICQQCRRPVDEYWRSITHEPFMKLQEQSQRFCSCKNGSLSSQQSYDNKMPKEEPIEYQIFQETTSSLAVDKCSLPSPIHLSKTTNNQHSTTKISSHKEQKIKPLYMCPYPECIKGFKYMCDFRIHVRTHTDEKPFCCARPKCERNFARTDERLRHYRTLIDERSVNYEDCEKSIARSYVKDHLKRYLLAKMKNTT